MGPGYDLFWDDAADEDDDDWGLILTKKSPLELRAMAQEALNDG